MYLSVWLPWFVKKVQILFKLHLWTQFFHLIYIRLQKKKNTSIVVLFQFFFSNNILWFFTYLVFYSDNNRGKYLARNEDMKNSFTLGVFLLSFSEIMHVEVHHTTPVRMFWLWAMILCMHATMVRRILMETFRSSMGNAPFDFPALQSISS